MNILSIAILFLVIQRAYYKKCQPCYNWQFNQQCAQLLPAIKLHMSLHSDKLIQQQFSPLFISNQQSKQQLSISQSYSPHQVFTTAKRILLDSFHHRINVENTTQKAYRTFFTHQVAAFRQWYRILATELQQQVTNLIQSGYWEILGGAILSPSLPSAYYDDIILNFEIGLTFLKEELNYIPKIAISYDALGFSQSTIALLSNFGIEGYLLLTSDSRLLLQNRTQLILRAISSNNHVYGSLVTHISWLNPHLKDLFLNNESQMCKAKDKQFNMIRRQNQLLRQLGNGSHFMRSFNHGIQKLDDYMYQVLQHLMERQSMEKCPAVMGFYSSPTNFFLALMGEVVSKSQKDMTAKRPGSLETILLQGNLLNGQYKAVSSYFEKYFRDFGRLVLVVKKMSLPLLMLNNSILSLLNNSSQLVAFSQQYDQIKIKSNLKELQASYNKIKLQIKQSILDPLFQLEIGIKGTIIFDCILGQDCQIPGPTERKEGFDRIGIKIMNPGQTQIFYNAWIELPLGEYWAPSGRYNILCVCPESNCPCRLYLLDLIQPYSFFVLTKISTIPTNESLETYSIYHGVRTNTSKDFQANQTHLSINLNNKTYTISYKLQNTAVNDVSLQGDENEDNNQREKRVKLIPFQRNESIYTVKSPDFTVICLYFKINRMKTLITVPTSKPNQWQVQTFIPRQLKLKHHIYLQLQSSIKNNKSFYIDSNGWLVTRRKMASYLHNQSEGVNIQTNMHFASAFAYIQDAEDKLSVNLDRAQRVASLRPGNILINFATRGSYVPRQEQTKSYQAKFQKYTHWITVQNKENIERKVQKAFDQPLIAQAITINRQVLGSFVSSTREKWEKLSEIGEIKWTVSPLSNRSILVRLHNLKDWKKVEVKLAAGNVSPLLTSFYGRTVTFSEVKQMSLGGNMDYGQFMDKKWNWPYIPSLKADNLMFNRIFRQNITLQPLQIRTFKFTNLNFSNTCIGPEDDSFNYTGKQVIYTLKSEKPAPKRSQTLKELENKIERYLIEGDHCGVISPVRQPQELFFNNKGASEEHTRKSREHQQQSLEVLKGKVEYYYPLSKHQKQHYFMFKLTEISNKKERKADSQIPSLAEVGQKIKNSQQIT